MSKELTKEIERLEVIFEENFQTKKSVAGTFAESTYVKIEEDLRKKIFNLKVKLRETTKQK